MHTTPGWRKHMRERRKAQGLTQGQLARIVSERARRSLSQPEICQIEKGALLSHWSVREISSVLRLSPPSDYQEPAEPPTRESLLVQLENDELVQLDDWALEQGLTTADGHADRAAAVRDLVRQYVMEQPREDLNDPDSMLQDTDTDSPDEPEPPGRTGDAICIHLLCHDDYGVTVNRDGTFDTRAWRVAEKWLLAGTRVAMHASKSAASYRHGWLVSYRPDTKRPTKVVLKVRAGGGPVAWPDSGNSRNSVRIRRS